mmetsp:Transcript_62252/g.151768  ORF Transcript_62252/g.151768 Transcript_62252/m.151768 type:complete len:83 (+) Transcript_62252:900-1148(+)
MNDEDVGSNSSSDSDKNNNINNLRDASRELRSSLLRTINIWNCYDNSSYNDGKGMVKTPSSALAAQETSASSSSTIQYSSGV